MIFLVFARSIKGFIKDHCNLHAASLTFFTLLAIVPLAAILFGIAQQIGVQEILREELTERFKEQQDILHEIIQLANNLLKETKGTLIAGFGFLFLFWSVLKLFRHLENALNNIWHVHKKLTVLKRIGNFFLVIISLPLFLLTSAAIKIGINNFLLDYLVFQGYWGIALIFILKMIPLLLITCLFAFIYYLVPQPIVSKKAALIGGLCAAIGYQILQWIYINFQMGATRLGAIYGSFVALPLFFIWLHFSWQIFLLGAEIVYAEQMQGDK